MNKHKLLKEAWKHVSEEKIVGGLADNKKLGDVARHHAGNNEKAYVMLFYLLKEQLKKCIKVESEHTTDLKIAEEIALDHLMEDPDYYTKLSKAKLEENVIQEQTTFDIEDLFVIFDDEKFPNAKEKAIQAYNKLFEVYSNQDKAPNEIPAILLQNFIVGEEKAKSELAKETSNFYKLVESLMAEWDQSMKIGNGDGSGAATFSNQRAYFPFSINYADLDKQKISSLKSDKLKNFAQYEIFKKWYTATDEKKLNYLKSYLTTLYQMYKGVQTFKENAVGVTRNPGNIPRKVQEKYNAFLPMIQSKFESMTIHDSNMMLSQHSPSTTNGVLSAIFGKNKQTFANSMKELEDKYKSVSEIPVSEFTKFIPILAGPNGRFVQFIITGNSEVPKKYKSTNDVPLAFTNAFNAGREIIKPGGAFEKYSQAKARVEYATEQLEKVQNSDELSVEKDRFPVSEARKDWENFKTNSTPSLSFEKGWIQKALKLVSAFKKMRQPTQLINAIIAFATVENNLKSEYGDEITVKTAFPTEFEELSHIVDLVLNSAPEFLPNEIVEIYDNMRDGKVSDAGILKESLLKYKI